MRANEAVIFRQCVLQNSELEEKVKYLSSTIEELNSQISTKNEMLVLQENQITQLEKVKLLLQHNEKHHQDHSEKTDIDIHSANERLKKMKVKKKSLMKHTIGKFQEQLDQKDKYIEILQSQLKSHNEPIEIHNHPNANKEIEKEKKDLKGEGTNKIQNLSPQKSSRSSGRQKKASLRHSETHDTLLLQEQHVQKLELELDQKHSEIDELKSQIKLFEEKLENFNKEKSRDLNINYDENVKLNEIIEKLNSQIEEQRALCEVLKIKVEKKSEKIQETKKLYLTLHSKYSITYHQMESQNEELAKEILQNQKLSEKIIEYEKDIQNNQFEIQKDKDLINNLKLGNVRMEEEKNRIEKIYIQEMDTFKSKLQLKFEEKSIEHQKLIEELQKQLNESESKLDQTVNHSNEKLVEIEKLTSTIKEKNNEIDNLQVKLTNNNVMIRKIEEQKEKEINGITNLLSEKEKECDNLLNLIKSNENEFTKSLEDKITQINNIQELLNEEINRSSLLQTKNNNNFEVTIQEKNELIFDNEKVINELRKEIEIKSSLNQELEERNNSFSKQINISDQKVSEITFTLESKTKEFQLLFDQLQKENNSLNSKILLLNSQIETEQKEIQKVNLEKENLLKDTEKKFDLLNKEIFSHKDEMKGLLERVTQKENEINSLKEEFTNTSSELNSLISLNNSLTEKLTNTSKLISDIEQEKENFIGKFKEMKLIADENEKKIEELNLKIIEQDREIEKLNELNSVSSIEINLEKSNLSQKGKELKKIRKLLSELQSEKELLTEKNVKLNSQIEENQSAYQTLINQINEKEKELQKVCDQNQILENQKVNFSESFSSLKESKEISEKNYQNEIENKIKEIEIIKGEMNSLKLQLQQKQEEISENVRKFEEKNQNIKELEEQLSTRNNELISGKDILSRSQSDFSNLQNEILLLTSNLNKIKSTNEMNEAKLREATTKAKQYEEEIRSLSDTISELIANQKKESENYILQLQEKESEKEKVNNLMIQKEEITKEKDNLSEILSIKEKELQSFKEKSFILDDEKKLTISQLEDKNNLISQLELKLSGSINSLSDINVKYNKIKDESQSQSSTNSTLEEQNIELKKKISSMKEVISTLELSNHSLQSQMYDNQSTSKEKISLIENLQKEIEMIKCQFTSDKISNEKESEKTLNDMKADLNIKENNIKSQNNIIKKLETEIESLNNLLKNTNTEYLSLQSKYDENQNLKQILTEKINQLEESVNIVNNEKNNFVMEISDLKLNLEKIMREFEREKDIHLHDGNLKEELNKKILELERNLESERKKGEELMSKLKELEIEKNLKSETTIKLEMEILNFQKQIEEKVKEKEGLDQRMNELKIEIDIEKKNSFEFSLRNEITEKELQKSNLQIEELQLNYEKELKEKNEEIKQLTSDLKDYLMKILKNDENNKEELNKLSQRLKEKKEKLKILKNNDKEKENYLKRFIQQIEKNNNNDKLEEKDIEKYGSILIICDLLISRSKFNIELEEIKQKLEQTIIEITKKNEEFEIDNQKKINQINEIQDLLDKSNSNLIKFNSKVSQAQTKMNNLKLLISKSLPIELHSPRNNNNNNNDNNNDNNTTNQTSKSENDTIEILHSQIDELTSLFNIYSMQSSVLGKFKSTQRSFFNI